MTSSDDGGYVHDPSTVDADADGEQRADGPAEADARAESVHPSAVDRKFDWRGWTLVGVLIVALFVAPTAIYLVPPGAEGYRFALLILPLAPAVLLAITAVWATTRP